MRCILGRECNLLDVSAIAIGLIALVLHALGTSFPAWWVLHEHELDGQEVTLHYGIWAIRVCEKGSCAQQSSGMEGDRAWLIGPATLLVLAGVMLLVVVVLHVVLMAHKTHKAVLQKLCVVLSAGAGAVIILAVLIFYKKKAGLRPSTAPETTDGDPGWALFVSTFGGIVGIGNGILIAFNVRRNFRRSQVKILFGSISKADLEIDVNALRRGDLVQGVGVNVPEGPPENRLYKKQISVRSSDSLYTISEGIYGK